MNHQSIYDNLIQKCKSENRIKLNKTSENYIYYEKHHILPKCMGGNDDKENLVLLTTKEHYIAHKLLTYIYTKNRKIIYAYHKMTYSKNGNYIKTSKDYIYARELIGSIDRKGKNNLFFGKHHTKESKIKIKEFQKIYKLEHNGMRGKIHSFESRQKMSIAIKGKRNGQNNPMYGKHQSEETKNKLRKPQEIITCCYCNISGGISLMHRHHFNNCKQKIT